jgi:tetratricopeptide (TPR) repeat protein
MAGAPRPAGAQESAFVAGVQELPANPSRPAAVRDRMKGALAGWDREIRALEAAASQSTSQSILPGASQAVLDEAFERHLTLGLAYRRRGRLDEALRQLDRAAALRTGASDVLLLKALTLDAAARREDAGRAFHAAWARDADSPVKAYLMLARTGALDSANLGRANLGSANLDSANLGSANLGSADRERAMDVLRQALQRVLSGTYRTASPATGPPFLTLDLVPDAISRTPVVGPAALAGVFARLAGGQWDEAIAAFDNGEAPVAGGTSALARGRAAEADGRFSDARREYATALAGTLAGRHALYVGIGRLAQVQGEPDAAIEAFSQAVRLSPNDPVIRRELAAAYVVAGRTDDAFAELVAALLIAPDDAAALAAIGQLYLDTDRPAEAIPVLRRTLAVRTDRYETHYALAVALSRAGQTDEAAGEFERFERLSREALDARRRTVAGEPGPPEPAREDAR